MSGDEKHIWQIQNSPDFHACPNFWQIGKQRRLPTEHREIRIQNYAVVTSCLNRSFKWCSSLVSSMHEEFSVNFSGLDRCVTIMMLSRTQRNSALMVRKSLLQVLPWLLVTRVVWLMPLERDGKTMQNECTRDRQCRTSHCNNCPWSQSPVSAREYACAWSSRAQCANVMGMEKGLSFVTDFHANDFKPDQFRLRSEASACCTRQGHQHQFSWELKHSAKAVLQCCKGLPNVCRRRNMAWTEITPRHIKENQGVLASRLHFHWNTRQVYFHVKISILHGPHTCLEDSNGLSFILQLGRKWHWTIKWQHSLPTQRKKKTVMCNEGCSCDIICLSIFMKGRFLSHDFSCMCKKPERENEEGGGGQGEMEWTLACCHTWQRVSSVPKGYDYVISTAQQNRFVLWLQPYLRTYTDVEVKTPKLKSWGLCA